MSKHLLNFSATLATAVTLLAAPAAQAQIRTPAASPASTITQRVGLTDVTIVYSRPSLKGRTAFGDKTPLAPLGQRWRTGANATTSIKFSDDVTIDGKKVPAGEYGIYTIPRANEWTVVLNKSLKQGADVEGFKEDQDVARLTVKPYKAGSKVESFTINFTDLTPGTANVAMEWGNVGAKFKITADVDSKVLAQIDEKITKNATPSAGDLAAAAVYYADNNKDMKQAVAWMEKANATDAKFWNLHSEAKMRLKMKDYAGAIKAAEASKKGALAATPPNGEYVKMNEELMAAAKKAGK
ncbi:DUF2911 domain-containing protein [Hymenobacter sp. BT683]|uniref:DUF2911 domain-containing protein n=1 Tax=Hymenobacter jeongseonensis TaxID=2791027 RepID=A0ABS0IHG6_9BACT|nr:DUF2911 domain-containing protein [Hymenobacter jeongseonensis]MBF9237797.1 DUF2911 domain-containing protein [Hymenobacter jeongseonensis]